MEVLCSNGKFLISEQDAHLLEHKWQIMETQSGKKYVRRTHKFPGIRRYATLLLHREILGVSSEIQVDHINGDGLDNRRENLRVATICQQRMNSSKRKNSVHSCYKGVTYHIKDAKWVTQITLFGKSIFWREYACPDVAAWIYDIVAGDLFEDFASLNFLDRGLG